MLVEMVVKHGELEVFRLKVTMVTLSLIAKKGNVQILLPALAPGPDYHADEERHHFVFWANSLVGTVIEATEEGVTLTYAGEKFNYHTATQIELMVVPGHDDYEFAPHTEITFVEVMS
jgi:hypothetical protein